MNDEFPYYYECQICGGVAKRMRRKLMHGELVEAECFEGVNRGDRILCDKCGGVAHSGYLNPMVDHVKPFINEVWVNIPVGGECIHREMKPCHYCNATGSSEVKLSFGEQSYSFPSVCVVCGGSGEVTAIDVTVLKSRDSNNEEINFDTFYSFDGRSIYL